MAVQPWRRGLLARVTLIYAVGALLLTSTVAMGTYLLARNRLVSEAESAHRQQALFNAVDIRNRLEALPPILAEPADPTPTDESDEEEREEAVEGAEDVYASALGALGLHNGSGALIVLADGTDRSKTLAKRDIPTRLQAAVGPRDVTNNRWPVTQLRYLDGDSISYTVAVYLPTVDATYYEVLDLEDLESTLRSLQVILIIVAIASAVAGAGLGYYSARGALAPIRRISSAAEAIAEGDFSTKLDLETDRDLAGMTNAFNEMVDAVSDRIEREQRFTSDVSHELRSPLMTLTASVEVLERRKESLPDVVQQAIDLLSHDLNRFQRLVKDLLEVSRMEAGAVRLQLTRFRLAEFLENVIFLSKSPHLQLDYDPADAELAVTADKRRLAQVMTNLLENAEKYGQGPTGMSYEVVGGDVQIVVSDSGPGVPSDQRERIFERFRRIEAGDRSSSTGFGLGLALVAEHVRLHGGSVWVTDRIDGTRGARFVVQLPIGEHVDVAEEMAL